MSKQEYIQQKWEEAGFIWDEIKGIVNGLGVLELTNPELKYSLTGFEQAHSNCSIIPVAFFEGKMLFTLDSLSGTDLETNNGWKIINIASDLPDKACLILVINKVTQGTDAHHYWPGDETFVMKKWSHYKIADSSKPLY